jgi:hypothetical protein
MNVLPVVLWLVTMAATPAHHVPPSAEPTTAPSPRLSVPCEATENNAECHHDTSGLDR